MNMIGRASSQPARTSWSAAMKRRNITNAGLARSLLATLGREAATRACRSNLWFGIAAEIEAIALAGGAHGGAGGA